MLLKHLGVYGWREPDENLLLASLLTGDPLLLIGKHGCAKTHAAAKVAQALGSARPSGRHTSAGRSLETRGNARPREMTAPFDPPWGLAPCLSLGTEFGLRVAATSISRRRPPKGRRRPFCIARSPPPLQRTPLSVTDTVFPPFPLDSTVMLG